MNNIDSLMFSLSSEACLLCLCLCSYCTVVLMLVLMLIVLMLMLMLMLMLILMLTTSSLLLPGPGLVSTGVALPCFSATTDDRRPPASNLPHYYCSTAFLLLYSQLCVKFRKVFLSTEPLLRCFLLNIYSASSPDIS
jgi:hypothetical protein